MNSKIKKYKRKLERSILYLDRINHYTNQEAGSLIMTELQRLEEFFNILNERITRILNKIREIKQQYIERLIDIKENK